jgi:UDP-N-acetylmuramate dehydrogenase
MILVSEVLERLEATPGLTVLPKAPLSAHTRFGLGGACWFLADANTEAAFLTAYRILRASGLPWTSIGGGTNLIVSDAGYQGAVLRYSAAEIRVDGTEVHVDAGADLNTLIDEANAHGLAGMESMAGIPGWTGAAIYGNAGAYGQSIEQRVRSVRFFDGEEISEWMREDCGFRYRHSRFKDNKAWQILSAKLSFRHGEPDRLAARSREIRATRDAKFPPEMRCAGSIFKNLWLQDLPDGVAARIPSAKVIEGKVAAGWFLEQAGAKGLSRGDIHVADYHANLVYNGGSGTASDLALLLDEMKDRVLQRFGILLEEEVQYIGFESVISKRSGNR